MIGAVTDLLLGAGVILNGAGVILLAKRATRHERHHVREASARAERR